MVALLLFGCTSADDPQQGPDGQGSDGGIGGAAPCPPPGPYGYELGDTLTDVALDDCDGQELRLHDLCGARVAMAINYYGWCPSCQHWLELASALAESHGPRGLTSLVVVTEDPLGEPATASYCLAVREAFELSVPVVYDPTASMEVYGANGLVMLSDRAATIIFKRDDATENAVIAAIEQELAAY